MVFCVLLWKYYVGIVKIQFNLLQIPCLEKESLCIESRTTAFSKGQIISKCLFGVFNFLKKKVSVSEKKIRLQYRYRNWTLVSVSDTETWFRSHTMRLNLWYKVQKAPVDNKLPTSDFVLQGIYDQKPFCDYEITNKLFYLKLFYYLCWLINCVQLRREHM